VLSAALSLQAQIFDPDLIAALPDLTLQPNTIESFELSIQNNGSARTVNGIAVYLEVLGSGPTISDVDVITGTIFGAVANSGPSKASANGDRIFYSATTATGTVDVEPGSSKFASVAFDTTGIAPGSYTYTLNTSFGATFYSTTGNPVELYPTSVNGTLTVVPEPAEVALLTGLACMMLAVFFRKSSRDMSRSDNLPVAVGFTPRT
jgi:hypothetical protein